ncbi:hypothetical protein HNP55_003568 [Paucibacter oligotrophus]|uniref:Mu-like prophage I protein n=1 Tax=Roseateles oligotrophus TaxID=1769250 RepID=A0A840LEF6_9BURK|nr:hypothetical protein [Roseateles oligotrophus]MBB4845022.1 hypothetical protein [Roseateles oligotrophus]
MQAAKPNPTLPDGIEIFRSGTRTAENGQVYTITDADVAATAAAYDPSLHEAPLTVGHPEGDHPAYGWVRRLVAEDGVLKIAEHDQVEPQFAEMVQAGRFKKRSAAFYHPTDTTNPKPGIWYPRHVAWLGAQPPAVKGLKDVQFSEAAPAVSFSEPIAQSTQPTPTTQEQDDMTTELQAQLDAANAKLAQAQADAEAAKKKAADAEAQAVQFAEKARADRKAQLVSFAEAQVQAGRLLPKDKDMAVATLVALDAAAPVEFSEGNTTRKLSPGQWLQDLITAAAPKVQFGEFAPGNATAQAGGAKGKSDAEIDQAARAYAAQHKVNYSEALRAVTSFAA